MVKIYSGNGCMQCKMVKKFLDSKEIPYEEKNVHENDTYMEEIKNMGFSKVPVTFLDDGTPVLGFDIKLLKETFK